MTSFPPPPGFDGWRVGEWGDHNYERACTPEEAEILEADQAIDDAAERAEDEQFRDGWFRLLRAELDPPAEESGLQ